MATAAIGIICKAPKAGDSKTRLIPRLGPERAAALARAFLIDLSRSIEEAGVVVGCAGYAICSPESAAAELATFLPPAFDYVVKTDRDLGRVLDGATQELLARGHESAILVNGDSPTLPAALLIETVRALREPGAHAVFVPALDGGYSIVGLTRRTPEIFADIPWSSAALLHRPLRPARLRELHARRRDLGTARRDLERPPLSGLSRGPAVGPAVARLRKLRLALEPVRHADRRR